jgi:ubiquitin thioesterase protein OTUB1
VNVESDQIHIVAMANSLGVSVKVANLDQSGDEGCNFHEISPMDQFKGDQPMVGLLYRPGHYDIIYIN